jgi:hypothetical protein
MEKPQVENLKALVYLRELNNYQRSLAIDEFNRLVDYVKELEQLTKPDVEGQSEQLPSDDIFDMPEVDLKNPLEEFYYYERPAYLEDDQKQFRERLQKALDYLSVGNHVFCPHCGDKLQLKVETDLNSGRVCKSALCKGK